MAEHFLDHAQVRTILQKMRGKAMPQHVRGDVAGDAGAAHAPFDPLPHRGGGEPRAEFRQKYIGRGTRFDEWGPAAREVTVQRRHRLAAHRNDPFLVALADHVDETGFEMELFQAQAA